MVCSFETKLPLWNKATWTINTSFHVLVTVIDSTVVSLFGFLYCIVVLMLWRTYCLYLQGAWISSGGCWYCTAEKKSEGSVWQVEGIWPFTATEKADGRIGWCQLVNLTPISSGQSYPLLLPAIAMTVWIPWTLLYKWCIFFLIISPSTGTVSITLKMEAVCLSEVWEHSTTHHMVRKHKRSVVICRLSENENGS